MLDSVMNKQSEKKGRFLIQEIDDENISYPNNNNLSEKLLLTNTNPQINISKRPKHSSIIMDSKIIHTTRGDSSFSNIMFSTLIFDENLKDWVDFDNIWKEFSKGHIDLLEDDMEKIFYYIADNSELFYLNNSSHYEPELQKIKDDDRIKIIQDNDNKINQIIVNNEKCNKPYENHTENNKILENISRTNQKLKELTFTEYTKSKSNTRNLVLTNICDATSIISPPISPIGSSTKFSPFHIKENLDKIGHCKTDKNNRKTKITFENINNKNENKKQNFQIIKNLSFAIVPYCKNYSFSNNNLQIVGINRLIENKINDNEHIHKCVMCKNKI